MYVFNLAVYLFKVENKMFKKTSEHIAQMTTKNVYAAHKVVQALLTDIEKLVNLQLNVVKQFLTGTSQSLKEISTSKNSKDLCETINSLASNSMTHSLASYQNGYELVIDVIKQAGI